MFFCEFYSLINVQIPNLINNTTWKTLYVLLLCEVLLLQEKSFDFWDNELCEKDMRNIHEDILLTKIDPDG